MSESSQSIRTTIKDATRRLLHVHSLIKEQQQHMRKLRKEYRDLESHVSSYIETHQLTQKDLRLQNYTVRYLQKETFEPFSQAYVRKTLESYFQEMYGSKYPPAVVSKKTEELFDYLVRHRSVRTHATLKILTSTDSKTTQA